MRKFRKIVDFIFYLGALDICVRSDIKKQCTAQSLEGQPQPTNQENHREITEKSLL